MMARRSLALVLLAGLTALALWWLLQRNSSAPESSANDQAAASLAAGIPVPASALAESAALQRQDAAAQPAAAPERILTVRVVSAADGSAAAGAEVLLLPLDAAASPTVEQREEFLRANVDEQLDRWGRIFTCDTAGLARVPVPDVNTFSIAARAEGRWGRTEVRNARTRLPEEIMIELRRALHLRVLVVDESRRPVAGVPVVYRRLYQKVGNDAAESVSDQNGIARFQHLQEATRGPGQTDEHVVALGVPAEPTVQTAFNPLAPPEEPIILVLPATGVVEVLVLDAAGNPIVDGLHVVLQTVRRYVNDSKPSPRMWVEGSQNTRSALVESGIARFERVGLGLDLEYAADFSHTGYLEQMTGKGPQRAGETVLLELRQSEEFPFLTGRVVNEAGQPVAERLLQAEVVFPGERALRQAYFKLRTDGAGCFRTAIPKSSLLAGQTHLVLSDAAPGFIKLAVADYAAPLPPGDTDLGDMILGGPLLVSGVALDPDGLPRSDAEGRITLERPDAPSEKRIKGPYEFLLWQAGEDGSIKVQGNFPPGRYRITGQLTGLRRLYSNDYFEAGASDMVLQFRPSRGVYGRILVDDNVPVQEMCVTLETKVSAVAGGIGPDGAFSIHRAQGSALDLVVRTHESGAVVLTIPGLTVDPDQLLDIGEIDLRGKLVTTRVSVLGPVGVAEKYGRSFQKPEPGAVVHQKTPFPHTFITVDRNQSCWIEVGGFMLTEVRLDGLDKTVRLAPAHRITIQVDGLPPCPAGAAWNLSLRGAAAGPSPGSAWFGARVGPDGSAEMTINLEDPGTLVPELRWKDSETGAYSLIPGAFGDPPASIELTETSLHQEFRLLADAAVIARGMGKE